MASVSLATRGYLAPRVAMGVLTRGYVGILGIPLSLAAGWAVSTHGVRVVASVELMMVDPHATGDALNPLTWSVVNNRTNASHMVIGATIVSPTTVDLILLDALGSHLEDHTITAIDLLDEDGDPVAGPATVVIPGIVETLDPIDNATIDTFRDRDLANPPFQVDRGIGYAGTIIIGSDGDYDTETGAALLKKLVLRRLSTPRGRFRHLPTYGLGITEKEPVPSRGDIVALASDIESQVRQEPDVAEVRARCSINRQGVLLLEVFVRGSNGQSLSIRMGSSGGRLMEM